uniref:Uncharacterized protein n=1 Tax=Anguilla anguilla TaxID=7936 RepID=A0A0E9R6Q2_ANGAN
MARWLCSYFCQIKDTKLTAFLTIYYVLLINKERSLYAELSNERGRASFVDALCMCTVEIYHTKDDYCE